MFGVALGGFLGATPQTPNLISQPSCPFIGEDVAVMTETSPALPDSSVVVFAVAHHCHESMHARLFNDSADMSNPTCVAWGAKLHSISGAQDLQWRMLTARDHGLIK